MGQWSLVDCQSVSVSVSIDKRLSSLSENSQYLQYTSSGDESHQSVIFAMVEDPAIFLDKNLNVRTVSNGYRLVCIYPVSFVY